MGLVVRFVPFSEMIDYLSGTPRLDLGISTARNHPLSFAEELVINGAIADLHAEAERPEDEPMLAAIRGQAQEHQISSSIIEMPKTQGTRPDLMKTESSSQEGYEYAAIGG